MTLTLSDERRELPARAAGISSRCTSLKLRKAARAASQFLETYLQPLGLHASQFGILSHLSRAGSLSMTELSDEMSLDRTTVTRNLQVLQRDGLVRVVAGEDRRVREVGLTEHGCDVLARAIPLWEQAEAALSSHLSQDERNALQSIASTLGSLKP